MTNSLALAIALTAAGVQLRCTVPGPGQWWLMQSPDASRVTARVVAAGRSTDNKPVHVSAKRRDACAVYWTLFIPDVPSSNR